MKSSICTILVSTLLTSCATTITQSTVFQPQADNRRAPGSTLEIEREDDLRSSNALVHGRITTSFGTIATSHAKTGSNRLIVACMGNAGDRKTDGIGYLNGLVPYGDALVFDYPGYGDSAGSPSLQDFEITIDAIAEHAAKADYDELVVWGHSLGGFVCGEIAKALGSAADAMIFETTASNVDAVTDAWLPWYAKPFVRLRIDEGLRSYDNVAAMADFHGPIAVLGATKDRQLPVKLSRELAEGLTATGKAVTYIEFEGARHMNVSTHADYAARMTSFFEAQLTP
ncbi:MAG: alpha/beta fold hydrolase [Pseudomonadota bacterium]